MKEETKMDNKINNMNEELNPEEMEKVSGGEFLGFGIGTPYRPMLPMKPTEEPKDGGATGSW